jgi:hypothetical protein
MEKEVLESLLIDYIDGTLSPSDRLRVEQELAQNEASRTLYDQLRTVMGALEHSETVEPGEHLRTVFAKTLQQEVANNKSGKTIFFRPVFYRAAAAIALVMVGVSIGYWIDKNQSRENELLALKKEVESTKQMMLVMLDNQQSASQRMMGTTVAYSIQQPDDEIVSALVKSMNEDPNTNVRLAALEALIKFHQEPVVRKKLIESLSVQKDPSVQITLIQLMVKMKERGVINQLQLIVDDAHTIKAVKDEALSGLLKLS